MILRLRSGTPPQVVSELRALIEGQGLRTFLSPEPARPIVAIVDEASRDLIEQWAARPEVEQAIVPRGEWRLVDRAFREGPTSVNVGSVCVGAGESVVIAGPCSVEGRDLILEGARICRDAGAHILRGGAFKPRTSPYAFQGLGREGLAQLKDAGESVGLPVISEIMDATQVNAFQDYDIDCMQVGARNMQNFTLLKSIAAAGRPVLLKRGLSATVAEWLAAAEYLAAHGSEQIILCERGIRTFETATRNTLDLTVLPLLRQWTHLPILVDPSHAAGIPELVAPLSRAAIAAGADGVAVEVHPRPNEARSDGAQALLPGELARVVAECRVVGAVLGRGFHSQPQLEEAAALAP